MPLAFLLLFPPAFIGVWLLIGLVIPRTAGWGDLAARFPDRAEIATLKLGGQSGTLRVGVNVNGALAVSVCPSGLRVSLPWLVSPFSRPFLVPWSEIRVERRTMFFRPVARLDFGTPPVGALTVATRLANRLGRAAPGLWPEAGPFPRETAGAIVLDAATYWALSASVVGLALTLAPRLITPALPHPPLAVTLGFPAAVFGVVAVARVLARLSARGA
jgi:hypothetical protein